MKFRLLLKTTVLTALLIIAGKVGWGQVAGDFRSLATGNWSATASWERLATDGSTWEAFGTGENTGTGLPASTSSVYIRDGHTITIDQNAQIVDLSVGEGTSGVLQYFSVSTFASTGNTTNGSNTITGVASTAGLIVGTTISGTGIPSATTVTAFTATTITLSLNATATGTGVALTFCNGYYLTLTGNLAVKSGGAFNLGSQANNVDHVLNIAGNISLSNGSTLNFGNSASKGVIINFNKSTSGDQTISSPGTPTLVTLHRVKLNRPTSSDKVVCSVSLTSKGSNQALQLFKGTWEQSAGTWTGPSSTASNLWLESSTGNLLLSGSGSMSLTGSVVGILGNNGFEGGLTVNTSGSLTTGSANSNGRLQSYGSGILTVQAGTVNVRGRLTITGAANISGGTINIYTQGVGSALGATSNAFEVSSGTGSFTMSGGTIIVATPIQATGTGTEIRMATGATYNITGGTIVVGDGGTSFSTTGTTTNASNSITGVSSTSGVKVGYTISGTGIPAGTFVSAFTSNTITLSANATASATVSLTIAPPTGADGFQINTHTVPLWNLVLNGTSTTPNFTLTDAATSAVARNLTIQKDLTINSGTVNANFATTGSNITFGGVYTNNGTLNLGTTSTITLNGATAQSLGTTFPATVPNLTLNNTSGINLDKSVNVTGTLNLGGNGNYTTLSNLAGGGYTNLTYSATVAQTSGSELKASLTNLTLNNSAGITISSPVTLTGILTLGGNATYSNLSNITGHTGLIYSGTVAQTTTNDEFPAAGGPATLTINNALGVTLHATRTISGALTLTSGKLDIGNNNLTYGTTTGASATSYVNTSGTGVITTLVNGAVSFPVGTSASYAPVSFAANTSTDNISVRVKSPITNSVSKNVKLEWYVNEGTPGGNVGNLTFQWNAADQASGFSIASPVKLGTWNGTGYDLTAVPTTAGTGPYTGTLTSPATFTNSPFVIGHFNAISSFTVPGQVGTTVIDDVNSKITFVMPVGADLSALTPTIVVAPGATVSPLSGAAQAFVAGTPVTYTVTAADASTQAYAVTAKTEATFTMSDKTVTYTGLAQSITPSATVPAGLTVDVTYNGSSTAPTAFGTYSVVGTVNDATYGGTVTATLTINKAVLTVTANNKTRLYGDTNPTFDGTITGYVNAETSSVITGTAAYTCPAIATTGIGTPVITTDVSGMTATNYSFSAVNGTLTINPAVLTVTADNKTKVYGDANPVFTGVISGYKNSETAAVITGTAAYTSTADATTGIGTPVITTDISGMSAANYTFSAVNGTLTITKALLTVTADAKSRVYGDANPSFTGVITGYLNSDNASVITGSPAYTTTAIATTGVGTPVITTDVSGMTASNYSFTGVNGVLTITKAALTVTADNKTKVYGEANPVFTGTITGYKNSEDATVITGGTGSFTCLANATSPAGTPVTITTDISGMSAANYTISAVNGTLTITKAPATVTLGATTFTFDGNPKPVSVTTTPVGLAVDITYAGSSTAPSAIGDYAIVATVNETNYSGTATGTLTITSKIPATVAISGNTVTYTGVAQPVVTTTTKTSDGTPIAVTVDVTYNGSTTVPTNAGNYAVVATINDATYAGTSSATLTINKVALTVTADNASRVYGATNPTFTGTISGYVNSETSSVITGSATYSTTATATTAVSTANIVPDVSGMSATNYSFTAVNGTLTITKAVLTVTAENATRIYGAANPAFTSTITGMVNSESLATACSGAAAFTCSANATSPVGTPVVITPTVGTLTSANYSFTFVDGSLTISKAVLTVTADNATRVYGDANPTFTGVISGYLNGEDATVVTGSAIYSCSATASSPAGTPVPIIPNVTGLSAANYSFTAVNGALTITKATATIAISNTTQAYDGAAKPVTIVTIPAGLTVTVTYAGSATVPFNAGSYAVVATINDVNYQGTQSATLVITPTTVTSVLYESFDYTAGTFVGGDATASPVTTSSNNWTAHSGTGNISVGTGSLTYTGLKTPTGNKVSIPGVSSITKDINRAIVSSNTTLYYSALINIKDNTGLGTSDAYFLMFAATDGASVSSFGGRLGIKLGTTSGFRFSIQNISTGTPTFTDCGQDLAFGTTYLVVVKYDRTAVPTVATLWVNPTTLGSTDPTGSVTNASGTGTFAAFKSIAIRNSYAAGPPVVGTPNADIDEIRVGTTFADVTPIATTSPEVISSATTLPDFGSIVQNTVGGVEGSFVVSGNNLANNLVVTPPAGFDISTVSGTGFSATNPVTLAHTSGTVSATTIYVKFHPTAVQAYTGNITVASIGATSLNVAVTGTGVASDVAAPAFVSTYPKSASIATNSFNVLVKIDEPGKVWFLKLASGAAAPTSADVKSTGTLISAPVANTEYSATITGLTLNTAYDVYFITEDNQATPNLMATPVLLTVSTLSVPTVTIHDIQYTLDVSGDSPMKTQAVTTTGIVTGIKMGTSGTQQAVYIQDGSGQWSGLYVFGIPATPIVAVGDKVTVTGTITEYSKLTEMSPTTALTVVSSGNPVPSAELLTCLALSDESYESILVKTVNANCVSGASGSYVVNDGTKDVTIYKGINTALTLTVGNTYAITGFLAQFNALWEIYPRTDADVINSSVTLSSTVYTVDATTITNIPYSATFTQFIANLVFSTGSTYKFYLADGVTETTTMITGNILKVTSQDGLTSKSFTITMNTVSSAKDITAYGIGAFGGTITGTNISVQVGSTYDLTNLVATFTLSQGASATIGGVAQVSGTTANNFTNPVTYVVKAEDASTKSYIVTVTKAGAAASDLFFSEYIEGTSYNKAFEIYNPTSAAIDLHNYTIKASNNGVGYGMVATTPPAADARYVLTFPVGTMIASKDVYVVYDDGAAAEIVAQGDLKLTYFSSTLTDLVAAAAENAAHPGANIASFNGNDGLGLFKGTTLIDAFGPELTTPVNGPNFNVAGVSGAAMDHSMVRKPSVHAGNSDWTSSAGTDASTSEWIIYDVNTYTYLGSHTENTSSAPTVSVSSATMADFGNVEHLTSSDEKSFTVQGSNLSANIVITAPAGFYISLVGGITFDSNQSPITILAANAVTATTIYVKFHPIAGGPYTGNITITSTGATSKTVAVSGTGLTTGITPNWDSKLNVYPNPFTDVIRFNGALNVSRVIVTSVTGQVLRNVQIGEENTIDTQDLPKGMYIVTFMNSKGERSIHKMAKN